MKLYYMPGACPLVSHIVLKWIGQPCDLQEVPRDELKGPEFLALNPLGSVPVLVDGDFILTQNNAILEYLVELNPQAGLHGKTAKERAEVRRWLGFLNSDLHRTFALIFGVAYYTDDADMQQQIVSKTEERLKFLFNIANKQLADKDWLTGTRSIADPYLYVLLRWAKAKDLNLAGMENLHTFFERMATDAGVQAALKEQGLN